MVFQNVYSFWTCLLKRSLDCMFIVVLSDVFRMICLCVCGFFCGFFFCVCYLCGVFSAGVICLSIFFHVSSMSIGLDKLKLKVQRHFTTTKCSHKVLIKCLFRCQEVWVFKNEHVPNEFAWDKNKWFRHSIEKSSSVFIL